MPGGGRGGGGKPVTQPLPSSSTACTSFFPRIAERVRVLRTPKASDTPGLEQTEGLGVFSDGRAEEGRWAHSFVLGARFLLDSSSAAPDCCPSGRAPEIAFLPLPLPPGWVCKACATPAPSIHSSTSSGHLAQLLWPPAWGFSVPPSAAGF